MSCRGGTQIIGQRIQVGLRYAGQIITIEVNDTTLCVYDHSDQLMAAPITWNQTRPCALTACAWGLRDISSSAGWD